MSLIVHPSVYVSV